MPTRFFWIGLFVACTGLCAPRVYGQTGSPSHSAADVTPQEFRQEIHPGTYLVFPFENGSRIANLDWLGEGLSELTVERLQDRGLMVLSRQDRLATLEKIGLPDSARFSHATLVRIASEADADVVVYGRFGSDGKTVTLEARVLHMSPPSLSPALTETAPMQELLRAQARLTWQILCAIDAKNCLATGANRDESSFSDPPASLRFDAFENFVRGLTGSDDETRLRLLREASRLEPAWDRPAFALGQIYFERRDCESALPWLSRVPPNRPDGPEASFDTGVCHLLQNDATRAEASFSVLIERARSNDPKESLPEFPEVHNNLGVSRLRLGKYTEAGAEFEHAAGLDPDEPNYWVNLGLAKLSGKVPASAVTALEHARKLDPDDKEARLLLISTLDSLGRSSEAAAIRTEAADGPGRAAPSGEAANPPANASSKAQAKSQSNAGVNLQDPVELARLARVSKQLDLTPLRLGGEVPASRVPSGQRPRKSTNNGEPR